jgi:hypothetical protein
MYVRFANHHTSKVQTTSPADQARSFMLRIMHAGEFIQNANDPDLADTSEMPNNCPQLQRAKPPNQSSPSAATATLITRTGLDRIFFQL